MRYANDLTSSVEAYIKKTLVEKIMKANEPLSLCNTAQEIREYLCDNSTVNTPEFVLRRYIYNYHPELFAGIATYESLSEHFYHEWPEDVLKQVAKLLSDISKKEHGLKLSTSTWYGYLTGKGVKKRNRVLELAFVLQMDVESTLELLLAYDMEPYSVRNPIELICTFCQKNPYKYTWNDVEDIFKCFEEGAKEKIVEEQKLENAIQWLKQGEWDFWSSVKDKRVHKAFIYKTVPDEYNEGKFERKIVAIDWSKVNRKDRNAIKLKNREDENRIRTNMNMFNSYVGKDVLYVHARQGGGNRDYYPIDTKHPMYLSDCDDFWDSTYCDIYYDLTKMEE